MVRQKIKIKDIAKMAGVSAGTVDRILHNRGNVSRASREAVERVLAEVNYKFNLHISAISCRKTFRITVTTPIASPGEYWSSIQSGIEHAIEEYSDINISCNYAYYNQYDIYSCKSAFNSITDQVPDAVIIGPTFVHETQELCKRLDAANIPYIFVDSVIPDPHPVATFTTDHYTCGFLVGKLLLSMSAKEGSVAILGAQRTGNERASTSLERHRGFRDYMARSGLTDRIREASFSVLNPEETEKSIMEFIQANRDIRGIAVMNSRGYIIADILRKKRNQRHHHHLVRSDFQQHKMHQKRIDNGASLPEARATGIQRHQRDDTASDLQTGRQGQSLYDAHRHSNARKSALLQIALQIPEAAHPYAANARQRAPVHTAAAKGPNGIKKERTNPLLFPYEDPKVIRR